MNRAQHSTAGDFIDAIADSVTERVAARLAELLQTCESRPHQAAPAQPVYLTEKETCARYRFHPKTLQAYRREGGGPPFMRAGKKILYRADEVEAWLRRGGNGGRVRLRRARTNRGAR